MGTLQKRPNGSYTAKIRRKGFPPLSGTFPTKAEADAWMVKQEAAIAARIAAERAIEDRKRIARECAPRYQVFADLMRRYLETVTPTKRGAHEEAIRLRGLLKHSIAFCPLSGLTTRRVAEWRDERMEQVSGSTVNRDMNLLAHVIELAKAEWEIPFEVNPFRLVRRPPEGTPRERRLSKAEEAALLRACATTQNSYVVPIIVLALETAMRRGEIVGLDWGRVHLHPSKRAVQLTRTKTGMPRPVPLSSRAIATLSALRPATANGAELTGSVFPGLTANALKLAFRRAVERAGIPDFRFHDLRHEATSRLFEKGLTVMEVASITGHQDVRMLRRYTHLHVADLARKLD
ncbi:site-specific integrase [Paraburkholderia hospita]|uniref:site-specific integrase n=1 Tax=Paraburkholderia hospita TaxID=169430 RepID=UPI003ECF63F4